MKDFSALSEYRVSPLVANLESHDFEAQQQRLREIVRFQKQQIYFLSVIKLFDEFPGLASVQLGFSPERPPQSASRNPTNLLALMVHPEWETPTHKKENAARFKNRLGAIVARCAATSKSDQVDIGDPFVSYPVYERVARFLHYGNAEALAPCATATLRRGEDPSPLLKTAFGKMHGVWLAFHEAKELSDEMKRLSGLAQQEPDEQASALPAAARKSARL